MNGIDATLHDEQAIRRRLTLLRCPDCGGSLTLVSELRCDRCRRIFFRNQAALDLLPSTGGVTFDQIATFWGDIYQQCYEATEETRTSDSLKQELVDLEDLFRLRRHMPTREVALPELENKEVLEIGSGAGGHSALFRRYGAHVTAVDITPERVISTARKLQLLEDVTPGDGLAIRGNAETLPFAEGSFDLVYSNGVLHHTPDTQGAVAEVLRVLKPGGQAVVMLYSRHSALFWLRLLPLGILSGKVFLWCEEAWIGWLTEGRPKFRGERNPITRVFSWRQARGLFRAFEAVKLRKFSFSFAHLPIPHAEPLRGRLLGWLGYGPHPGGRLVYGSPFVPETMIELRLGRLLGYAWAVSAMKAAVSPDRINTDLSPTGFERQTASRARRATER